MLKRSYPANQFLFSLDDNKPEAGLLRAVSGGTIKSNVVSEGLGNDLHKVKHQGLIEIEPIELELGMSMSRPFLDWISESWSYQFSRRNGAIIHADFDYHERLAQWFYEGLIVETKFPDLDGSSKDPAYLKVKLHPERLEIKQGTGHRIGGAISSRQKKWLQCNFELDIDGIDCSHVNKIEGFSVKQGVHQFHTGESRYAELEPTKLEFPDLTVYTALAHAGEFLKWHEQSVVKGVEEKPRQGHLVFLGPNNLEELFSIRLDQVGIRSIAIDNSKAGQEDIKRVKVELFVESMALEYGGGVD